MCRGRNEVAVVRKNVALELWHLTNLVRAGALTYKESGPT